MLSSAALCLICYENSAHKTLREVWERTWNQLDRLWVVDGREQKGHGGHVLRESRRFCYETWSHQGNVVTMSC